MKSLSLSYTSTYSYTSKLFRLQFFLHSPIFIQCFTAVFSMSLSYSWKGRFPLQRSHRSAVISLLVIWPIHSHFSLLLFYLVFVHMIILLYDLLYFFWLCVRSYIPKCNSRANLQVYNRKFGSTYLSSAYNSYYSICYCEVRSRRPRSL